MTIAFGIIVLIVILVLFFRQKRISSGPDYRRNTLDQDLFGGRDSSTPMGSNDFTQSYEDHSLRHSHDGGSHHTSHSTSDSFSHADNRHDGHSESHSSHDSYGNSSDSGSYDSTPSGSTSFDSPSSSSVD